MIGLTGLADCLDRALAEVRPLDLERLPPANACGCLLAESVCLPSDQPGRHEALRAGFAVSALELVGASNGSPLPLPGEMRVLPAQSLPAGTDAVLPDEATEPGQSGLEAVRPVQPGEGVRRAGHDGRRGEQLASAGQRVSASLVLIAELCGIDTLPVRQARVQLSLDDQRQTAFVKAWLRELGASPCDDHPDLIVRTTRDCTPRLALAPAETAWLERERAGTLLLSVPRRFDGLVAAMLGLGLPALRALLGASLHDDTRPLTRKLNSTIGWSELVLLTMSTEGWAPAPAGTVTLTTLASAQWFAILGPESEGLRAGEVLSATPISRPLG
jgi:molybdopterin molybdotransferase